MSYSTPQVIGLDLESINKMFTEVYFKLNSIKLKLSLLKEKKYLESFSKFSANRSKIATILIR